MSLLLGVNIDHVATLRQARYALNPDAPILEPSVLDAAREAQKGGADSITIHVREDRRHMQDADARLMRKEVNLPLNFELANTVEMVAFACDLKPDFACLVPESREEITTEGGLDAIGHFDSLKDTIIALQGSGIKVSLFIDPEEEQIEAAAKLGAEMIELHTGSFALAEGEPHQNELSRLRLSADLAASLGLQVNAGHGIHRQNINSLFSVKNLKEINVGHTLVSRALFIGLRAAVAEMKALMAAYQGDQE
ncbi:pyridoxine 5'-phosphate synthase [Akkermansiaceae bacterium]|jgi:pyridoxine 5-phosphate synthase|nr:pyridoxine 5'-phosphate synthase [Akkermansiaceae bacterium]|tara:strand:+ start:2026 stop:2781 length:756 start_codon:yes stop_codon:yes gene_type:complete